MKSSQPTLVDGSPDSHELGEIPQAPKQITKEYANPPRIKGWDHSEQVLVYYKGVPELSISAKYSIAYYHYKPPFEGPNWIDFTNPGRIPFCWWDLPVAPELIEKE